MKEGMTTLEESMNKRIDSLQKELELKCIEGESLREKMIDFETIIKQLQVENSLAAAPPLCSL